MGSGHEQVVVSCEALPRLDLARIERLRVLLGTALVRIVYYVSQSPERLPSLEQPRAASWPNSASKRGEGSRAASSRSIRLRGAKSRAAAGLPRRDGPRAGDAPEAPDASSLPSPEDGGGLPAKPLCAD